MANQVRLTLLQAEGTTGDFDWPEKLKDAISRLPTVREKIVKIVQFHRNEVWSGAMSKVGFPVKPFAGALSIYSSDVDSLKELISTILKEDAIENSPAVWVVGYDEVKMSKAPKDPSKPLAKFMGLMIRNPNLTTPQFHSHWTGPHAALFSSNPRSQETVVLYTQFHSSPEWTEEFTKLGLNIAAYEGVVEVWFESLEDLESVFASQEFMEEMMPNEAILLNLEESGVMIGVDEVETTRYTISP